MLRTLSRLCAKHCHTSLQLVAHDTLHVCCKHLRWHQIRCFFGLQCRKGFQLQGDRQFASAGVRCLFAVCVCGQALSWLDDAWVHMEHINYGRDASMMDRQASQGYSGTIVTISVRTVFASLQFSFSCSAHVCCSILVMRHMSPCSLQ